MNARNNLLIPDSSIGADELCVPRWRRQRGGLLGFFSKKDKKKGSSCLVLARPIMSLLIFPARQVAERKTNDFK